MKTSWDRKIGHIHRKVRPMASRRYGLQGQMLKAKVKRRRGLPSRNLPLELVLDRLRIEFPDGAADQDIAERRRRLDFAKMRKRLLERKRRLRNAALRKARPKVTDTRIYLWRRRQEWLRSVEDSDEDTVRDGRLVNPP